MDVTLLELQLPNAEFNAPFAGRPSTDRDDGGVGERSAPDSDPSARLGLLAALLGFAGLALLARYLRGGEAEPSTVDEVEA